MEPYEVVASPLVVWLAPTGTAFPGVEEAEGAFDPGWVKLGAKKKIGDDGVTVTHENTIEVFRGSGTAPMKAFRTEEGLLIEFELHDLSSAVYAKLLNDAALTQVAAASGVPGTDTIQLAMGETVVQFALLARGLSPEDEQFPAQYQVPRCFENAVPAPQHKKGEPAALACEFMALDNDFDADEPDFGELVIQTDAALP